MHKLKPILENILFKRYVNSLLNEQSIATPPIRIPSSIRYTPWKIPTPSVEPVTISPKPTMVPSETPGAVPVAIPGTQSVSGQTAEKMTFDDAQNIIKNEIEVGLSKTRNQKELVNYVFDKQSELLSDPEYGTSLSDYAGNEIKNRLGLAKSETTVTTTPVTPKPFEFPTNVPTEMPDVKPLTTKPSTAPVEEPESTFPSENQEPSVSAVPALGLLYPSILPMRYSKIKTSPSSEEEYQLQRKPEFERPNKLKTATGFVDPNRIRKQKKEDGMESLSDIEIPEDDEIEPYKGSLYDVDADLLLKNILGKYSGTYRIE